MRKFWIFGSLVLITLNLMCAYKNVGNSSGCISSFLAGCLLIVLFVEVYKI